MGTFFYIVSNSQWFALAFLRIIWQFIGRGGHSLPVYLRVSAVSGGDTGPPKSLGCCSRPPQSPSLLGMLGPLFVVFGIVHIGYLNLSFPQTPFLGPCQEVFKFLRRFLVAGLEALLISVAVALSQYSDFLSFVAYVTLIFLPNAFAIQKVDLQLQLLLELGQCEEIMLKILRPLRESNPQPLP